MSPAANYPHPKLPSLVATIAQIQGFALGLSQVVAGSFGGQSDLERMHVKNPTNFAHLRRALVDEVHPRALG